MMNQFSVINGYLCVVDMNKPWDYFYGVNRIISSVKEKTA